MQFDGHGPATHRVPVWAPYRGRAPCEPGGIAADRAVPPGSAGVRYERLDRYEELVLGRTKRSLENQHQLKGGIESG